MRKTEIPRSIRAFAVFLLPHLSLPFSRMNLNFRFSEDDDIFLHERGIPLSMVFLGKNSTV